MEHQRWSEVQGLIRQLARPKRGRCDYSDGDIARTYYWAVVHDRPTAWACDPKNWPLHARRRPLPPPWTMSRRLRSRSVVALLEALDRAVLPPAGDPPLVHLLDGSRCPSAAAPRTARPATAARPAARPRATSCTPWSAATARCRCGGWPR